MEEQAVISRGWPVTQRVVAILINDFGQYYCPINSDFLSRSGLRSSSIIKIAYTYWQKAFWTVHAPLRLKYLWKYITYARYGTIAPENLNSGQRLKSSILKYISFLTHELKKLFKLSSRGLISKRNLKFEVLKEMAHLVLERQGCYHLVAWLVTASL